MEALVLETGGLPRLTRWRRVRHGGGGQYALQHGDGQQGGSGSGGGYQHGGSLRKGTAAAPAQDPEALAVGKVRAAPQRVTLSRGYRLLGASAESTATRRGCGEGRQRRRAIGCRGE